MFNCLC